ncbi:hypothetical protein ACFL2H_05700 [Planctomycetota bacterium]
MNSATRYTELLLSIGTNSTAKSSEAMHNQFITFAIFCTVCTSSNVVHSAEKRVEIEVLTESRAPLGSAHEWLQVLKQLKFDLVRMRSKRANDNAPSIKGNTPTSPTIKVIALLTADNKLAVPKASFRRSNTAALAKWLEELRNPVEAPSEPKASSTELIRLRQQMLSAVTEPTKGVPIETFLAGTRDWNINVSIDRSVRLPRDRKIAEELSTLSRGTALAIAVRQFNLVVAPEPGGQSLRIMATGKSRQSWPIGWKLEQPVPTAVPKLAEIIPVEIKNTPLADVLAAIENKVGFPFIIDHLELTRRRIDLQKINVNIRPRRIMYKRVLDSILVRNMLTGEVRADEAGKPFYWVTTLKRDRKDD